MNKTMLDLYSDYLISQTGLATSTGLSDTLCGEVSHGKVSRCLRDGDYGSKALWSYLVTV